MHTDQYPPIPWALASLSRARQQFLLTVKPVGAAHDGHGVATVLRVVRKVIVISAARVEEPVIMVPDWVGDAGVAEVAPFDTVLDDAVPETVPEAWLALAEAACVAEDPAAPEDEAPEEEEWLEEIGAAADEEDPAAEEDPADEDDPAADEGPAAEEDEEPAADDEPDPAAVVDAHDEPAGEDEEDPLAEDEAAPEADPAVAEEGEVAEEDLEEVDLVEEAADDEDEEDD